MGVPQIRPTQRIAVVSPSWRPFFEETGIPAAVRHDSTLYVTGHTGEDDDQSFSPDPEEQIRRAFLSVAQTLAEVGADWSDVVQITSYHLGLRGQAQALLAVSREFLANPAPAWSAVGVSELWDEGSVVEISCIAVVRHSR